MISSDNEGGRQTAWAHNMTLEVACGGSLNKSLNFSLPVYKMERTSVPRCVIALTATLLGHVKCSGRCPAHCSHSVNDRYAVIAIASVIILAFPGAKRNKKSKYNLKN